MNEKTFWVGNVLAGMTQATLVTVTGYPFDLIKVKMQSRESPHLSSMRCVADVVRSEGIGGLYRGSVMPWLSHMIKRPLQFPVTEYLKTKYSTKHSSNNNNNNYKRITNNYLIGALSGITGPIFGTPLQVVKVGMQTSDSNRYKNSYVYAKDIIKSDGIRGLYRGFIPTLMKDSIFGGSFVGTYYTLRDVIGSDNWYKNFFNGAAAHCITWYLFIPIDYVKTNIQSSVHNNNHESRKITDVIRDGYKRGGIRVFWKGVVPACVRTIPVSGVAMTGYEMVRKKFY